MIAVIRDYVTSLARNGFERFYFLNGHGGNIATTNAAFSEVYAETSMQRPGSNAPSIRCKLKNWWENPGVKQISAELYGDREGSHATPSEVSVTQFAYPDAIKRKAMAPVGPKQRDFADADDYRRLFPDGRIGSDPTLVSDAGAWGEAGRSSSPRPQGRLRALPHRGLATSSSARRPTVAVAGSEALQETAPRTSARLGMRSARAPAD